MFSGGCRGYMTAPKEFSADGRPCLGAGVEFKHFFKVASRATTGVKCGSPADLPVALDF